MPGSNYEMGGGSFCFLRVLVLQQLTVLFHGGEISQFWGLLIWCLALLCLPHKESVKDWDSLQATKILKIFACSNITKFLDQHGVKMTDAGLSIAGQHVWQLQNNYFRVWYISPNCILHKYWLISRYFVLYSLNWNWRNLPEEFFPVILLHLGPLEKIISYS